MTTVILLPPGSHEFRGGWCPGFAVMFRGKVGPLAEARLPGVWPNVIGYDHFAPYAFHLRQGASRFYVDGLFFNGHLELLDGEAAAFAGFERLLFPRCPMRHPLELRVRNKTRRPAWITGFLVGPFRLTKENWELRQARAKEAKRRGSKR